MLLLSRIKSVPPAEILALLDNIGGITKKAGDNFGRGDHGCFNSSVDF